MTKRARLSAPGPPAPPALASGGGGEAGGGDRPLITSERSNASHLFFFLQVAR